MLIRRISPIDGKVYEIEIDVTEEQLQDWKAGRLIQHAMPDVSPEHRDFILMGITPEQWNALMGEEDDE
jgi:hypothetical protein